MKRVWILCVLTSVACKTAPSATENGRHVPMLKLLRVQTVPTTQPDGTRVGGLSDLQYDVDNHVFVAISDDRSERAPARFHTLAATGSEAHVVGTTTLLAEDGQPFPVNTVDPEGLALLGKDRVIISSEGLTGRNVPPFLAVFDRASGAIQERLVIPEAFLPDGKGTRGVGDNYGFEALSLCENGPLLMMNEAPLLQEPDAALHVLAYNTANLSSTPTDMLRYRLETRPPGMMVHGVTSMLCLDEGRAALVLERSWSKEGGFIIRIFHADFSTTPARKTLVVDVNALGIRLDNYEGLAVGPRLADGRRTLVMISDDNFLAEQATMLVWFAWE